jgi:hypothetical protein
VKRTPLKRKTPLKQRAPEQRTRKQKQARRAERYTAERNWHASRGARCVGCGASDRLTSHHICYRQHVLRASGDIWDARNSLTLCDHCHAQHHARSKPIPLAYLPDAALEFAFDLLGPAAVDYLGRHYSGDDARLFDVDGNPRAERVYAQEEAPTPRGDTAGGMAQGE